MGDDWWEAEWGPSDAERSRVRQEDAGEESGSESSSADELEDSSVALSRLLDRHSAQQSLWARFLRFWHPNRDR